MIKWLYPELKLFENDEQRAAALKQVKRSIRTNRNDFVIWVIPMIVCGLSAWAFHACTVRFLPLRYWHLSIVWLLTMVVTYLLWFGLNQRKHLRRSLRQILNQNGPRICVKCAYLLEQSQSRTCPECGTAH